MSQTSELASCKAKGFLPNANDGMANLWKFQQECEPPYYPHLWMLKIIIPATDAVMRHVTTPPSNDRSTISARSPVRFGAIGLRPPSCIPIEPRLAKPQRA